MSLLYILHICLYLFRICYMYIYVFFVPLYMVYENKDDWLIEKQRLYLLDRYKSAALLNTIHGISISLHVLKFLKICINLSKILINIHWMHCDIVSWTDMFQFLYTALQVPWLMLYSIHMLCTLSIKWSAYLLWHFHVSTNYIKYDNIRCHKMCYSTTTYSLHDTEHNILINACANFENLNFQKTRVKGGRRVSNS